MSVSITGNTKASPAAITETLLRGVRALLAVIRVLSGVLLVCSVALNFANVVGRYFFNASIPWAEEAMLFLMVGCVFLGNGVVAWSGRQIRMDIIVSMMPAKVREALDLFSELVLIATAVTIATASAQPLKSVMGKSVDQTPISRRKPTTTAGTTATARAAASPPGTHQP